MDGLGNTLLIIGLTIEVRNVADARGQSSHVRLASLGGREHGPDEGE